jgi:hypothetical protein
MKPALDGVATEGTFRHLRAFQDIASMSGGNRAAGTGCLHECRFLDNDLHFLDNQRSVM